MTAAQRYSDERQEFISSAKWPPATSFRRRRACGALGVIDGGADIGAFAQLDEVRESGDFRQVEHASA